MDRFVIMALLEKQLAALKQQEKELGRAIKTEQQRLRRQSSKQHVAQLLHEAGAGNLKPRVDKDQGKELVLLLELSGGSTDVVVSYALGQGRPKQCCHSGLNVHDLNVRSNIAAGVELLYLKVPFNAVVHALDVPEQQIFRMSRYLVEHHVFHWLVDQNCQKGVAPSLSQVLVQASRFVSELLRPSSTREKLHLFFLGDRAARMWAVSFRQRWQVQDGRLQVGEDMDKNLLGSKGPWCY